MMYSEKAYAFLINKATDTIGSSGSETMNQWIKSNVFPVIMNFLLRALLVVVVFFVGRIVIRFLVKLLDKSFEKFGMEVSLRRFLKYVINIAAYCLLILLIIMAAGKNVTSFVAIFSSAWVALGLSLQGSLSNFAGGILIMLFKPFKVGDYIIEGAGKKEGFVQNIGLVYTEILTYDNKLIVIPNGSLANNTVSNISAKGKRRVDIYVNIAYSADILKARNIIMQVLEDNKYLIKDERKRVFVNELGDSGVELGIFCWATFDNYFDALWSVSEEVKLAFDAGGVEIPFNQIDVHVKNT